MSLTPVEGVGVAVFQRNDLEGIGLNPRSVRTLEGLPLDRDALTQTVDNVISEVNVLDSAPFVVWGAVASQLADTREIADSANVTLTADATHVKADLTDTAVTPAAYGDASHVIAITVDRKGRIVSAQAFALNSDNVAEGGTHLFFTNARARSALSAGSHINYNSGTGAIAFSGTGLTGTFASPTSITVQDGLVTAIV